MTQNTTKMPQTANSNKKKIYKKYLTKCMNLVNGTNHTNDYNFTNNELYALRPDHIKRYLSLMSYGTENPDTEIDLPVHGRSSSLEFAKKAISFFMPNKNMVWNNQTEQGNPTRSSVLNDFIKEVKKKEVRKQGKASKARRPLVTSEFRQIIDRVRGGDDNYTFKYSLAAYYIFQFHMVARVDDVMHFKCEDLTPHLDFDFALKSKMCWSKNVLDERATTDQIILGAADPGYCTLLALAIHLEAAVGDGTIAGMDSALFGINKQMASTKFKNIVNSAEFEKAAEGELGSHSTRKYAATMARRNGCSRDDVDARGRWKGQRRIVDLYIDAHLPFPDAKVASSLCLGGPVKYELRRDSRISDDWLIENVAKNIASLFPRRMALVLGKALLWGICDDDVAAFIDTETVQRVRAEVRNLNNCYTTDNVNPVKKIPLIISGEEGALIINELTDDDNDGGNGGAGVQQRGGVVGIGGVGGNSVDSNQIRFLVSAVKSLNRQNEELKNELHVFKSTCNTLLSQLNTSVKRIAIIPSVRANSVRHQNGGGGMTIEIGGDGNDNGGTSRGGGSSSIPYESTLCKCPKSLHVLWQEYEFGVGGRKAAKTFSSKERGAVKFNYSLRNHFWMLMNRMISRGYTHTSAIDKIYSVYGTHLSATNILREIRKDTKNGGHAELR